jgi:hypothetical protein
LPINWQSAKSFNPPCSRKKKVKPASAAEGLFIYDVRKLLLRETGAPLHRKMARAR